MSGQCQKVRESIQDHLDGLEVEEGLLTQHLGQCPPCKRYHEDQEQLRETLTVWNSPAPSSGFAQSTLNAFLSNRSRTEIRDRRPWYFSPAGLWPFAVAAAVLFAVGFGLIQKLPHQETSSSEQMAVARAIGHSQMVDRNRDLRLMGVAYPARSFFPNSGSKR